VFLATQKADVHTDIISLLGRSDPVDYSLCALAQHNLNVIFCGFSVVSVYYYETET